MADEIKQTYTYRLEPRCMAQLQRVAARRGELPSRIVRDLIKKFLDEQPIAQVRDDRSKAA